MGSSLRPDSRLIGLSDDQGGERWIWVAKGMVEHTVSKPPLGFPDIAVGPPFTGNLHDIRYKRLRFGRRSSHTVRDFAGNFRISVVYFPRKGCGFATEQTRMDLKGCPNGRATTTTTTPATGIVIHGLRKRRRLQDIAHAFEAAVLLELGPLLQRPAHPTGKRLLPGWGRVVHQELLRFAPIRLRMAFG